MFPISWQWKKEIDQRAHHKLLTEMGTLLSSLILYNFPTKICPNLAGNRPKFMQNYFSDIISCPSTVALCIQRKIVTSLTCFLEIPSYIYV